MKKLEKYNNWIIALIFLIIVIAIYKTFDNFYKIAAFFNLVLKSLSPFVIGFVIAYILNMPAKRIDAVCRKSKYKFVNKHSKAISIVAVYFLLLLLLYIGIRAVVPAVYRNILDLYNNVPIYIDEILATFDRWQKQYNLELFNINEENLKKAFESILGKVNIAEFSKYAKGVINITSGVINAFIGIIVSVYMLLDKEKIKASMRRITCILLKKERSERLISGIRKVNEIFSKYLVCLILDALIMALLATVVLSLLKVRYAVILGIMIGVCNLIPYFGAIIAAVIAIVITLVTGGIFQGIWTAIALVVLQQADGNFIGPKIMGEVLDLSPLWIIFAVTLGGGIFGIGGMIISVPILVTVKMAITEFINEKETEQSEC